MRLIPALMIALGLAATPAFARDVTEIRHQGMMIVCANAKAMPVSGRGDPEGYQMDIARELARDIGVRMVVEWVWADYQLRRTECDMVLGAPRDPKPGGYLRLGLYSETARRAVTSARQRFATGAYGDDLASIRQFRRDLLDTQEEHTVPLWAYNDFYKTSEFRDLAMHVQEHQFTLPALKSLLKRNGLTFLGFSNPSATTALTKMPASQAKRRRRDFQAWERFEKRNPDAFANMYQFFCVKN